MASQLPFLGGCDSIQFSYCGRTRVGQDTIAVRANMAGQGRLWMVGGFVVIYETFRNKLNNAIYYSPFSNVGSLFLRGLST